MPILVDSNVLLDVLTNDRDWFGWSADALVRLADRDVLAINPIIYSEISIGFERIEDLDDALPAHALHRLPLPDFYIGAHASVTRMALLTRNAQRYRTYFPGLELIAPGG